jgi:hypothetical protein
MSIINDSQNLNDYLKNNICSDDEGVGEINITAIGSRIYTV